MTEPELPESLEPIEQLVATELEAQHAHLDAADTKAGIVLGFAAALVALSVDAPPSTGAVRVLLAVGTVAAGAGALVALTSFWPRNFEVLDVGVARDDALGRMPDSLTRVAIVDTRVLAITSNQALLARKALRLKLALTLVFAAAAFLGAGTLAT